MGTATLTNLLMTVVAAGAPSTNYDYQIGSPLRGGAAPGGAAEFEAYFPRPFSLGATIIDAKLHLWSTATAQSGTISIGLRRVKSAVAFNKVTWNTRPTTFYATTSSLSKTGPLAAPTEWVVDVTAQMQPVAAGDPWYGFNIYSTNLNPGMYWYMPGHTDVAKRPWLEVTWSDAPSKPRTLAPSGGRAVSVTKPVLRCDYTDVSGDTEMQAIQVQTSATTSFTSPAFDSGAVLTGTPELDLSATVSRIVVANTTSGSTTVTAATGTFGTADVGVTIAGNGIPAGATITAFGSSSSVTISASATATNAIVATIGRGISNLSDGQEVYWRVRVQDGAGLWSEWSDPASFSRDAKGTLTLNNPSSGTPIVEDATPPIGWTLTGETQAAYQVVITETLTSGQVKTWNSGKLSGTVNEVTPPAGAISSPDSTYTVTLRVWDTKQRETTAGDPAYYEVVRAFTYVPSATVTATSSPTAVTQMPYPRIVLTWQRGTDPDSFSILRNRVVIASGLIPNDVRQSGTTFTYTDRNAPPQTALTYEVQAVVNGKASAANPTVATQLASSGIWLADATRTNEVWLFSADEQELDYGESSSRVEIVGGTELVRVTQALRGLEGVVKGTLQDTTSRGIALTARQWRAKLLNIKAKPGQRCWLTIDDMTMQCVVSVRSIRPRRTNPVGYNVTLEVDQVGTLQFVPTL